MAPYTSRGSYYLGSTLPTKTKRKRRHLTNHRERIWFDCLTLLPSETSNGSTLLLWTASSASQDRDNHYPKEKFLATIYLLRWLPPYSFSQSRTGSNGFHRLGVGVNKEPQMQYIEETMTLSPIVSSSQINLPNSMNYMPPSWFWHILENHLIYIQTASLWLICPLG